MFCPGITLDATGRLIVSGGSTDRPVSIYDADIGNWTAASPMHIGRGYQSSVLTSNGDVFVLGGSWSGPNRTKYGEIYNTKADAWTELPGCPTLPMQTQDKKGIYRSDNHAWLFGWKDGSIFQAGPSKAMNWFFANGSGSYSPAGLRGDAEDSMCGNAVMYDVGEILTVGGSPSYDNTVGHYAAHLISLPNAANGSVEVSRAPDMVYPRVQANSVVLPSGEVFVTGGQAFSDIFTDYQAIYYSEMFDPGTKSFRLLEAMQPVPRTYHSVAILLPDGTVFTGGGGLCGPCRWNHLDGNIYEPPYLFKGNEYAKRPVITHAGTNESTTDLSFTAGAELTITTSPPVYSRAGHTFALVRAGSATHSTDTDQRRVPLKIASQASDSKGVQYAVQLPSDYGTLPAGWYMLFALDGDVPSLATWIRVALP
jgi:galactose oxidase